MLVCYVLNHLHGHGRLWQTAHRVEQTLQLSRHVVLFMGKVFKMFKILKINCRLALRILSSEADKTESETKITWAPGPSLANLASRLLWASTHFSTWITFFATFCFSGLDFFHPASTWASNPPGELCILDLSESSMSWLRCSKKALWDVKRMYFIAGGINDIIVCRGRLETSGDKRQKEKFWTFSREVETWWCRVINTEVILEDRWIANLRRLLSSGQSSFPSSSAQPPETRTSINTPRQAGTKNTWLKPCWLLKWLVSCCSSLKSSGQLIGQVSALLEFEDVVEEEEVEGGRWCSTGRYFSTAECASPVERDLEFCRGTS